ncbi:ethanolamine ammonia-lyase subunit EutC [Mangrovibacterium diazotrophicum]|uniref:Ethanolamine ammonia-lyase small subunit n=1 Tax=Mangrovibacterium diazotrophicum TaxID=1261403 RepID=A0A419VYH3_9BACT|nr:ethanolamine ammonia-lyase subunit EutC [Mangrovibacterium diazotrophicum]RKD88268.1 ethanolamine ammonia-lyase light chain [Mangrovibacterium diazotrophicum]
MEKLPLNGKRSVVLEDSWSELKVHSKARIALGHVGGSLPLREVLAFRLACAEAKDAIYSELQTDQLCEAIASLDVPVFKLSSKIRSRDEYLVRPDLGRRLRESDIDLLQSIKQTCDIVFVVTDGLSADAVNKSSIELITQIIPVLKSRFDIAVAVVEQGRVAIGDEIGELLQAHFSVVLVGERPGLSVPDSMGIYTTYNPRLGLTDERRNCISNIHASGLSAKGAATILNYLIEQSFEKRISGVALKMSLDLRTGNPEGEALK